MNRISALVCTSCQASPHHHVVDGRPIVLYRVESFNRVDNVHPKGSHGQQSDQRRQWYPALVEIVVITMDTLGVSGPAGNYGSRGRRYTYQGGGWRIRILDLGHSNIKLQ